MKSTATSAEQYLASLPEDRRAAVKTVRRFILDNLDGALQERMQYGVVAYCVPHTVWPHGHHTRPELPLMYMGLSSQKNDMVVYMLFLLHKEPERAWFDKAWKGTGRKNHLEVTGAGCCLRFKKVEELSLEVIAEAMRRSPVKTYLEHHVATLARLGRGPDGKPLKSVAKAPSAKTKTRSAASSRSGADRKPTAAKNKRASSRPT